jgi:hypothetical protein
VTRQAVEENTLGVTVGREGRHSRPAAGRSRRPAFRRPERTIKTARANQNALGGRHLAVGMMLSGAVASLFLLWRFAIQWSTYPTVLFSLLAWVLFAATVVVGLLVVERRTPPVPAWLFPAVMSASAIVVVQAASGSIPRPHPQSAPCSPHWSRCARPGRSSRARVCWPR